CAIVRRMVAAAFLRRHRPALEGRRLYRRRDGRLTLVFGRPQRPIALRLTNVRLLRGHRCHVLVSGGRFLPFRLAFIDSAVSAVVTDPGDVGGVVYHGGVVDVAPLGHVDVAHAAVVVEAVALPAAAVIPAAEVPVAIVHAAVEAHI